MRPCPGVSALSFSLLSPRFVYLGLCRFLGWELSDQGPPDKEAISPDQALS
jgi:hypothetical protein